MIRPFHEDDTEAVVALWEESDLTRPWNDPRKDIARKLGVQRDWFLVVEDEGRIVASVMAGYDGHRGCTLMAEVERLLGDAGCPKLNLQVRTTNDAALGFYERLGYKRDDAISLGRRLEHGS